MDQANTDISSLSQSPRRAEPSAEQGAGNRQVDSVLESALAAPRRDSDTVSARFKDIPVGQKLTLIALTLLLPIVLLLYFAVSQVQQDIAFAAKERVGVEYIQPTRQIQRELQVYRAEYVNASQGNADAQQRLNTAAQNITAAIANLEQIDRANNGLLGVSQSIATIKSGWDNIQATTTSMDTAAATPLIQSFFDDILTPFYLEVADNSNLTLDPEVASYYLTNLITADMPSGISKIGAFRSLARAAVNDGVISPEERTNLSVSLAIARESEADIFNSIERAKQGSNVVATQIANAENTMRTSVSGYLDAYEAGILQAAEPMTAAEASDIGATQRDDSYLLFDTALTTLDQLLLERIQGLQRTNLLTLAGVAASLILAFLVIFFITRQITRPLAELSTVSDNLARGNLNQLAQVDSRDEIGTLAKSFNNAIVQLRDANARQEIEVERSKRLQQNIGEFLNVAMDIAQGDLTKRGQVSEDALGNVIDSINFMTEELGYVLRDVQNVTESVNQGATDMFGTADSIARSSAVQAREALRAREDVQDIRSTMRQVSEEMTLSAESASKALVASKEGQQAVVQTLSGMQDIRREVQAVAKRVKSLGDRSLEISEIVETISKISEQTNLLAVNAAIESSGAGEAGLRFAVVADQVRKLAEESAYAAERVSILIKSVQEEVQEVITGVETGTREVEEGYRVASQAGQRLEDIASIVERSASLAQRISQATQEQVSRVEQVGQVVEQMAEISQESQETVTKGREAAEKLQQLAAQLSDNLSRFRLA